MDEILDIDVEYAVISKAILACETSVSNMWQTNFTINGIEALSAKTFFSLQNLSNWCYLGP